MRGDEYAGWLPAMREGYARSMIDHGGFSPDVATARAETQIEELFPGGGPAEEQIVFVLEADGEPVGELWLAEREDMSRGRPCLFVYDVHVDDAHQGRGYGKAAMVFAEEEARRRGLDRVVLNVFGRNEVARRLYRSLGYEENAVAMSKTVGTA
jgi:GNAT superfamily N-acetyltransferase